MLFDTFYSWGHPAREIAKMTLAPSTEPNRFNSNYIKTQRRVHVPIPRAGPPTLPSKGSDQWGQLIAKAVIPLPAKKFNTDYLKPNPENLRHVPPPRPYTKEGALASLKGATASDTTIEAVEVSPIEKATRIRDAQVDGSDLEKYWNDIIVSLTQLKDIQAIRPLTSQELQVQRDILQRIKDYELTNTLTSPADPPPAGLGSTEQIQNAIAGLPRPATAAEIQAAIAAMPRPATAAEIRAAIAAGQRPPQAPPQAPPPTPQAPPPQVNIHVPPPPLPQAPPPQPQAPPPPPRTPPRAPRPLAIPAGLDANSPIEDIRKFIIDNNLKTDAFKGNRITLMRNIRVELTGIMASPPPPRRRHP
jgi:hypothetical protein